MFKIWFVRINFNQGLAIVFKMKMEMLMGNKNTMFAYNEFALAGNRTRASRVVGENSTTEQPVHV